MFKWLGQQLEKMSQKRKQLGEREPHIAKKGLSEEQIIDFVDKATQQVPVAAFRSLLKTAIMDVDQVAASIKMKAQTEAEAEAAEIITQARQEALEVKRMAEVTEVETELKGKRGELQESKDLELRESEAILPGTSEAAAPPAEIPTSKETEIEPDIVIKEKPEEPVRLEEEAAVAEPVETAMEERLEQRRPEERPGGEEIDPALLKQGKQALYAGEVELAVAMPVNLRMISKLYDHLQTIPELRILHTGGSWDQGTTITVVLEKQLPLIGIISKLPGVGATPELSQNDSPAKGMPSSLLRAKKGKVKRIKVTLKNG